MDIIVEKVVGSEPVVVSTSPVATGPGVQVKGKVDQPPDATIVQTEIDRLNKVAEEAREKAEYWRKQKAEARADYFKGRQEPPTPPTPKPEDLGIGPEPTKETFDDYDKFIDAKLNWKVAKARVEWDREQAAKMTDTRRKEKMETFNEKINAGYKEYPDFEEVALEPTISITPIMAEIMADCENPHRVAYYFGKNRSEAIRISRLSPIQAAKEITKIEVEIAKAKNELSVPPKIPSAPPPIKPVGPSHTIAKDPEKMSQKEFEKMREEQGARRF